MFDSPCGRCWLAVVLLVTCPAAKASLVSAGSGPAAVASGELWVSGPAAGGDAPAWFGSTLGDMGSLGLLLVYNSEKNKYKLTDKLYCKVRDCVFLLDAPAIRHLRPGLVGLCPSLWISTLYHCLDATPACGGLIEK